MIKLLSSKKKDYKSTINKILRQRNDREKINTKGKRTMPNETLPNSKTPIVISKNTPIINIIIVRFFFILVNLKISLRFII